MITRWIALATLVAATPATAQTASGRQVYEKWCAACHDDNPGYAGTLALKNKYRGEVPAALLKRTDLSTETIAYFVRTGIAWMAPFRKTEISDSELRALTIWMISQSLPPRGDRRR